MSGVAMTLAARVLWTKQLTKKKKTWHDGYIIHKPSNEAILFDDAGKELATCRLPSKVTDVASEENLTCFEGYLVQGDSECDVSEVRNASGDAAVWHQGLPDSTRVPVARAPAQAPQPSTHASVPVCQRRRRSAGVSFNNPGGEKSCTAAALAADNKLAPALPAAFTGATPLAVSSQPVPAQATAGRQRQAAAPPAASSLAPSSTLVNSDHDILQLLDSIAPAAMPTSSNGPQGLHKLLPQPHGSLQQQHQGKWGQQQQHTAEEQLLQQGMQQDMQSAWQPPQQQCGGCRQWQAPACSPANKGSICKSDSAASATATAHSGVSAMQLLTEADAHTGYPADLQAAFDPVALPQQQTQMPQQGTVRSFTWHQTAAQKQDPAEWSAGQPEEQQQQQGQGPPQAWQQHSHRGQQQQQQYMHKMPGQPAVQDIEHSSDAATGKPGCLEPVSGVSARNGGEAPQQQSWLSGARQPLHSIDGNRQQQVQVTLQAKLQQQGRQQQQKQPSQGQALVQQLQVAVQAYGELQHIEQHEFADPKPPQACPKSKRAAAFVVPRAGSEGHQQLQQQQRQCQPQLQQQRQQPQGMGPFVFPSIDSAPLLRHVAILTGFSTAAGYQANLLAALTEEVNLALAGHARVFHGLAQQAGAGSMHGVVSHHNKQFQHSNHGQGPQHWQQGASKWQGPGQHQQQGQQGNLLQLQGLCSRSGLQYHPSSTLTVYQRSNNTIKAVFSKAKAKKAGRKTQAQADDDIDGDAADQPAQKAMNMYLTLSGRIDRRKFRKYDVWVLSSDPLLTASVRADGPQDRCNMPWTVLARSLWHGPDRDGKMEVELLPCAALPSHHKWQRQQQLTALLAPDLATEIQVMQFISSINPAGWPLLSAFMHPMAASQDELTHAAGLGATAAAVSAGFGEKAASCSNGSSTARGKAAKVLKNSKSSSNNGWDSNTDGGECDNRSVDDGCLSDSAAAVFAKRSRAEPAKRRSSGSGPVCTSSDNDSDDVFALNDNSKSSTSAKKPKLAACAVPSTAAAAPQTVLAAVVQQFGLNDAQAHVAAHIASWLPQLESPVQQRSTSAQQLQRKQQPAPQQQDTRDFETGRTGNDTQQLGQSAKKGSSADIAVAVSCNSIWAAAPPVCLIHGPFGTGKSTLLVALIHLLTKASQVSSALFPTEAGATGKRHHTAAASGTGTVPCPRILVAAHTNVAVDRVLLALMDSGFINLLRVGSLQRIAKRLLCHSLHSADDSKDALSQLQGMLQDATGQETELIKAEIAQLQAGAERQRRRRLKTAAVVGVTCCAALQATLDGQTFDVVLLDESSQMTEPISLVPLLRVKPRFMIAAGDPCQLPPVIASPTGISPLEPSTSTSSSAALLRAVGQQQQGHLYGLLRPLFVRLTHLGHIPHLLTQQYRCHPTLSAISNRHFYNSQLVNGVTAVQRAPLVPGLGPLVLCDCQKGRSQAAEGGGRSSINKAEAELIVQLVLALLRCSKQPTARQKERRLQERQQQSHNSAAVDAQREQESEQWGQWSHADTAAGVANLTRGIVTSDSEGEIDDEQPAVYAPQMGVICFFRGQAALIKQMLAAEPSCPSASDVQVATVDSFQGAEKELIILATTTTNPRSEFCSDAARLNVALTRAKRHLVVVGAADVLAQAPGPALRDLVGTCRGMADGYYPGNSILLLPALAAARLQVQAAQQQALQQQATQQQKQH